MNEVRSTSYQFSVAQTLCGLVVVVRYSIPSNGYGDWEWGKWQKAGQDELAEIMRRLAP